MPSTSVGLKSVFTQSLGTVFTIKCTRLDQHRILLFQLSYFKFIFDGPKNLEKQCDKLCDKP